MCGFVLYTHFEQPAEKRSSVCGTLCDLITHRGPDDSGLWSSTVFPISLAHRRLSILDLSPLGAQPMHSKSGRYSILFNGEIYNFQAIRQELINRGQSFHSQGDTEVLLVGLEEFGIEECLNRCHGMFAFALWDNKDHKLTLARDRLGKKPLFYGWHRGGFLAGSELRLFLSLPEEQWDLNEEACGLFFQQAYFPPPYTPLRHVWKLLPGTFLELSGEELLQEPSSFSPFDAEYDFREYSVNSRPKRYWNLFEEKHTASMGGKQQSDEEWVSELHTVLSEATKDRMISDVPLGAFLSGGIDSSLICALMQEQSDRPIETFTVRFEEKDMDEGEYAKKVAEHLGSSHHELYVRYSDALDIVPRLPIMFDEPLGDASQIPTFLVSQFARRHVTVALSGDAGDELFCGYPRYQLASSVGRKMQMLPSCVRKPLAKTMEAIPRHMWTMFFSALYKVLPTGMQIRRPDAKIGRLVELLNSVQGDSFDGVELYRQFTVHWPNGRDMTRAIEDEPFSLFNVARHFLANERDILEVGMITDILNWLTGDIFYKVDQASMATSLEARSPFCDTRVVRYALSLPMHGKFRHQQGKWILRQLLRRYFPAELFERQKQGFMIPLGEWLRGPLRAWGEELLEFGELSQVLELDSVRVRWDEHMTEQGCWEYHLWDVLQFLAWLKEWKGKIRVRAVA